MQRTKLFYTVMSTFVLSAGVAFGQDATHCSCVGPVAGKMGGVVTSVSGDVSALGGAGFSAIKAGDSLSVGTRVVTGPKGSANFRFGSQCRLSVGANTDVDISTIKDALCIRVVKSEPIGALLTSVDSMGKTVATADPSQQFLAQARRDCDDRGNRDRDDCAAGGLAPDGGAGGGAGGGGAGGAGAGGLGAGGAGLGVGVGVVALGAVGLAVGIAGISKSSSPVSP